MKRSTWKVICLVMCGIAVLFSGLTIHGIWSAMTQPGPGVGIIGGADAPTLGFLLGQLIQTPVFYAWLVALIGAVASGILWLCRK